MNSMIPWRKRDAENTVATNDPAPLNSLRPNWDSLIEQFFGVSPSPRPSIVTIGGPPLDLAETDDAIRVRAEVAGVEPKDLEINLSGDLLTITGEKRDETAERDGERSYSERRFGRFSRTVRLPCQVEVEQVKAEHENGVLTVTLPKCAAARPTRISISSR